MKLNTKTDNRGEYIVVDRDHLGNEYRVYVIRLKDKTNG